MCQHAGGPLGEGKITGDIVICPWHGYRYHIKTGQYVKNLEMSVACYPVKVEDGKISVAVASLAVSSASFSPWHGWHGLFPPNLKPCLAKSSLISETPKFSTWATRMP